jgi:hypothetical protein
MKASGDAILDRVIHRAHRIELKGDQACTRATLSTPPPQTVDA